MSKLMRYEAYAPMTPYAVVPTLEYSTIGKWVRYSDVEAQDKENVELRAELKLRIDYAEKVRELHLEVTRLKAEAEAKD